MTTNHVDAMLSNTVNISQYREFENDRDKVKIADFVLERFMDRYINPLKSMNDEPSLGYAKMVICCMMVETLQSFKKGLADTKGNSEAMFAGFFKSNPGFCIHEDNDIDDFYVNVRCSLLHQGEIANGWRIVDDRGVLIDIQNSYINPHAFIEQLELSLNKYCQDLKDSEWKHVRWKRFRKKMDAICQNCGTETHDIYLESIDRLNQSHLINPNTWITNHPRRTADHH